MLECSSSNSSVRKRRKTKKNKEEKEVEEHVDMISHLPDPLLHHIFSFLDIAKAIHTCILSRRWRYFWVSLPTLNFNYYTRRNVEAGYPRTELIKMMFMDFVDRVLLLRDNSSNIQKLSLVIRRQIGICDMNHITYRLDKWIRISVLRNIQQLTLRIANTWQIPHYLSNCKSLTKLVLGIHGCNRLILPAPGSSFTLPRLKTLSIEAGRFKEDDSIDDFISKRCLPVLETLILIDVDFLQGTLLNISSLKLKHLTLKGCRAYSVDIHLDSPNLISYYYVGSLSEHWIIENHLSSLVKADINVMNACAKQTTNILRELHNVEELTLSLNSLKISTEAPELLDNHSMQFLKLKCLKLKCDRLSLELFGVIAYLLNACPNVKTLCLRVCGRRFGNEQNSSSANQGDCWGAGLSLECLKFFEFRNVWAYVDELKFIEILLNKAVVLEKLFIVFGFGKSSSDDKKCRAEFMKKVLTFPRVSSSVAIMFQ